VLDPGRRTCAQEFPSPIIPNVSLSHEVYAVGHCHAKRATSCLTSKTSCIEQLSYVFWDWPDKQQNWLFHLEEECATEAQHACSKHSRHQFPRPGLYREFFNGGKPWKFPCNELRFCVRAVLVQLRFIPSNDLLQDILTMIIKAEEVSEGFSCGPLSVVEGPTCCTLFCSITFINNALDCTMWKIKRFFQLFKQPSVIRMHNLLSCGDKICWCGGMPGPFHLSHSNDSH